MPETKPVTPKESLAKPLNVEPEKPITAKDAAPEKSVVPPVEHVEPAKPRWFQCGASFAEGVVHVFAADLESAERRALKSYGVRSLPPTHRVTVREVDASFTPSAADIERDSLIDKMF